MHRVLERRGDAEIPAAAANRPEEIRILVRRRAHDAARRTTAVETGQLDGRGITRGEKDVGAVRSTLTLEDRRIGLAAIRREVEPGDTVLAGGVEARVVPLPFRLEELDP